MKKYLAVLLALVMMLVFFAGCTSDNNSSDLEDTKPNEKIREKLDAGMAVEVAFTGFVDNVMIMDVFYTGVKDIVEPLGVTVLEAVHAGGDVATQIAQIENFTTMNVACIVVVPPDAETIKDAVIAAQDAGVDVVIYGVGGAGEYTVATRADMVMEGEAIGLMTCAWAKQRYPDAGEGEIKAAVMGTYAIDEMKMKTDNIKAVMDAEPILDVVFFNNGVDDTIDAGYDFMEAAMTYDPAIRVIGSYSFTCGIGASNYVAAIPGADISEFAIFGSGYDNSTWDGLMEAAANNTGCYRGSINPNATAGEYLGMATKGALLDEFSAPYELMFEEYAAVEPNFDYEYVMTY